MEFRQALLGIAMALVATPVLDLRAQSNPWYIPPPAQPPVGAGVPTGSVYVQTVPVQPIQQVPTYGFGAGYVVQQPPQPATGLVQPGQRVAPYGQSQQPAVTGAVGGIPSVVGTQAYAAPAMGQVPGYAPAPALPTQSYLAPSAAAPGYAPSTYAAPTYAAPAYPAPTYAAPTYAAPPYPAPVQTPPTAYAPQQPVTIYVVPQQQAGAPAPLLGSYPPLGSDPTVSPAAQQPRAAAVAPAPSAPATAAGTTLMHPGFAGPSTLAPSYGAYPGLATPYMSPLGATPYLGLPFY